MREILQSKRGSSPIFTAIIVLVLSLIISTVMYIAYVEIQTTVIRNAMKTGLANLAYTISEDTYTALRESDFEEYAAKLTGESAYRTKLENTYKADVLNAVELDSYEYTVDAISLDFTRDGMKIRYTCTCDVTFYVRLFGINMPATAKSVQVDHRRNADRTGCSQRADRRPHDGAAESGSRNPRVHRGLVRHQ